MAKMTVKGFTELEAMLETIERKTPDITGRALYEGAGVMHHYVQTAILEIPADDSFGTSVHPKEGPSTIQKEGLARALGIAPHRHTNYVTDTSVGFSGYNSVSTTQWPQGQPNAMVARSVERGTSFMRANPFIKKAVKQAKPMVEKIMKLTAEEEIKKLTK